VGVLRAVVVFWLIWWAWTQFTWALNAANTDHHEIRLGTLASTGVAFVMATSVEQAFSDQALWFAVPYVVVRLLGLGLYYRVAADSEHRRAVAVFALASLPGLAAVIVGGVTDPSLRSWIWLGAIALDVLAAWIGGRRGGWNLHAGHFAERHGLIVIIALGESLILAGAAVASEPRTAGFVSVGATAVAATCLLWWTYFGWVKDILEERLISTGEQNQASVARDVYSLWHFPLVGGIIAYAVGVEGILMHPGESVSPGVGIALGVGVFLFVGSTAGSYWRATGKLLLPRILILIGTLGALAGTTWLTPIWSLVAICAGLATIVLVEHLSVNAGRQGQATDAISGTSSARY
jgi:low temperature requirement protein LtrA